MMIYKQVVGDDVVRLGVIDPTERTFGMTVSTAAKDRDGDIIVQDGWQLDRYLQNPIVLWQHDYRSPVGVVTALEAHPNHLRAEVRMAKGTHIADDVWQLVSQGIVRAASVGFIPHQWEPVEGGGRKFTAAELVEVSIVSVPANPEAIMALAKSYGLTLAKGATPFLDLPLDMEAAWDASAARSRIARWASSDGSGSKDTIDWNKYAKAFAWYDDTAPELFGSYKLPYADVKDGKLHAVWRAVVAVMAAILGARGGVDIPDSDRKGVYNHMAKYYEKAGKEPPKFRELSEIVAEMHTRIAILETKMGITRPALVPVVMTHKGG